MDDRRRPLLGDALDEPAVDLVDHLELACLRLLPLAVPALQLALDVGLLAAELAEADRVGVDGVDLDQRVDDPLADRRALPLARTAPRPRPSAGSAPRRSPSRRTARRSPPRPRRSRRRGAPAPACPAAPRSRGARGPCRAPSRGACRAGAGAAPSAPPAESWTPKVRFERPPEMRSKLSGGFAPGTFASNQASTAGAVDALGCVGSLLRHGRASIWRRPSGSPPGSPTYEAVLFDFGGVLTTPVWDSFAAFCRDQRGWIPTRSRTSSGTTPRRSPTCAGWRPGP